MGDSLGSFTDALGGLGAAAGQWRDAFDSGKREDTKVVQNTFDWKPILVALGGVLGVALVLKFAFGK